MDLSSRLSTLRGVVVHDGMYADKGAVTLPKGTKLSSSINGQTALAFDQFRIHLSPSKDQWRVSIYGGGDALGEYLVRVSQGQVEWRDAQGAPLGHELAEIPWEARQGVESHLLKESVRDEPVSGATSNAPPADPGELLRALKRQSFDSGRADVVKAWCKVEGSITSSELAVILKTFSFDSGRTEALRLLAPKVSEWSSSQDVLQTFSFSSGKDEARSIISGQD
jgi:hypothetical protein